MKETLSAVDGMLGAADEMLSARRGNSGGSNGVGKVVEAKTQVHPQRVGKPEDLSITRERAGVSRLLAIDFEAYFIYEA